MQALTNVEHRVEFMNESNGFHGNYWYDDAVMTPSWSPALPLMTMGPSADWTILITCTAEFENILPLLGCLRCIQQAQ